MSFATKKFADWTCPNCNDLQFARNAICRQCKCPRPKNAASKVGGAAPQEVRKGDWLCVPCNDMQFASRSACRKCGASKPVADDATDVGDADVCLICMSRVRNVALLHGDTMHGVTCAECAEDLMRNKQNCPMCRQPIERVVKAFQ